MIAAKLSPEGGKRWCEGKYEQQKRMKVDTEAKYRSKATCNRTKQWKQKCRKERKRRWENKNWMKKRVEFCPQEFSLKQILLSHLQFVGTVCLRLRKRGQQEGALVSIWRDKFLDELKILILTYTSWSCTPGENFWGFLFNSVLSCMLPYLCLEVR